MTLAAQFLSNPDNTGPWAPWSLLFALIIGHALADYVTAASSGQYAVREMCELFMGLVGQYSNVVRDRVEFAPEYQTYLAARKQVFTAFLQFDGQAFSPVG